MEDERISILMKYVQGEISFAEWIEGGVGGGDAEQDDNSMQVDRDWEEEMSAQMVEASDSQVRPTTSQDNSESSGKYLELLIDCSLYLLLDFQAYYFHEMICTPTWCTCSPGDRGVVGGGGGGVRGVIFPAVKHYFFLQNVFNCCQKIVIYLICLFIASLMFYLN